jgi:hypothetical protein
LLAHKFVGNIELTALRMNGFAWKKVICYDLPTMKQKFWITLVTYLAWCIDRELYKGIDYLKEEVRVLVVLQEKQNKQIRLNNNQRMRVGILPIAHLLTCQSSMKGILELPNLRVLSVRIHGRVDILSFCHLSRVCISCCFSLSIEECQKILAYRGTSM